MEGGNDTVTLLIKAQLSPFLPILKAFKPPESQEHFFPPGNNLFPTSCSDTLSSPPPPTFQQLGSNLHWAMRRETRLQAMGYKMAPNQRRLVKLSVVRLKHWKEGMLETSRIATTISSARKP